MSIGNQCDWCRFFGPAHSRRWLYLVTQPAGPEAILATLAGTIEPQSPPTFCSMLCAASWTAVNSAVTAPATGTEPEPLSDPEPGDGIWPGGLGWPG